MIDSETHQWYSATVFAAVMSRSWPRQSPRQCYGHVHVRSDWQLGCNLFTVFSMYYSKTNNTTSKLLSNYKIPCVWATVLPASARTMLMMTTVATIPAIDIPSDALPSLLAPAGSDTAVLLATTVYTWRAYHTYMVKAAFKWVYLFIRPPDTSRKPYILLPCY